MDIELISRNIFDEKKYLVFYKYTLTVWKLRKFTLTLFWQIFRETNVFTKEITK